MEIVQDRLRQQAENRSAKMKQQSQLQSALIQRLAHSEKKVRDKAVNKLGLFLASRTVDNTNDMDFLKLWKGLFYCMWMSDKTPVQQELAEAIARLIHRFDSWAVCHMWMKSFLETMRREWNGLDKYRLDKYYSLIRKTVNQMFVYLQDSNWEPEAIDALTSCCFLHLLGPEKEARRGAGVTLQIMEVYIEEMASSVGKSVSTEHFMRLLEPLFTVLAKGSSNRVVGARIAQHVIEPCGIDYEFKDCQFQEETPEMDADSARDAESTAEEKNPHAPHFPNVEMATLARHIWALASAEDTAQGRRSHLYALHKNLKKTLRSAGTHYQVTMPPLQKTSIPSLGVVDSDVHSQQVTTLAMLNEHTDNANGTDNDESRRAVGKSKRPSESHAEPDGASAASSERSENASIPIYNSDNSVDDEWESDPLRLPHGPTARTREKRVRIQLSKNRQKGYRKSVRDLKRRKLQPTSTSPQPRTSILKASSH